MTMNVYRPRPLHIEAIRYDGENYDEIEAFAGASFAQARWEGGSGMVWIWDSYLDEDLALRVGFYVVKTTAGTFTVMHPDLLDATHEQVGGL